MSEIDFQAAERIKQAPSRAGAHSFTSTAEFSYPLKGGNGKQQSILTHHPLALLFPPMTGEEFRELVMDIDKHGQQEPITLLSDQILDGRHRLDAIKWLQKRGQKIEPVFAEYIGPTDEASLRDFIVSMNLHRRHLTIGQRAILAAKLLSGFKKPERKIALGKGGSPDHNSRARKAADRAAAALGVSARTVEKAAKLRKLSPGTADLVEKGALKLDAALKQAEATRDKAKAERLTGAARAAWLKQQHAEKQAELVGKIDKAATLIIDTLLVLQHPTWKLDGIAKQLDHARSIAGWVRVNTPKPPKKELTTTCDLGPAPVVRPVTARPHRRVSWAHKRGTT